MIFDRGFRVVMAVAVAVSGVAGPLRLATGGEDAPVSYRRDVRPILARHCTDCHSGWFPDAGLDLGELDDILEGGPSGPLVVPGRPDKGWLMFSITRAGGRQKMPPDGKTVVSEAEKALLSRWIEQGLGP